MSKGRLLAIDFGTVRHGLAVSDPDRIIASPFDTYRRKDAVQDAAYFQKVVREECIVGLVVGLPIHTGGEEGVKSKEARAFALWLSEATGLPFEMWDERCTTAAAEDAMWEAGLSHKDRKARRDRVAAQIILQSYIDHAKLVT
jgi:putative Holliday junction resolvase